MGYYSKNLFIQISNASKLLDNLSNVTVAFALRKLSSTYNGYCIEVRRSSDNATMNIGFTNDVIDIAALSAFVGSNAGFVKTWYDQSGNGNNATQTTATTQPQIYTPSVIYTQRSKPSIFFNGSKTLEITSRPFTGATQLTFLACCNWFTGNTYEMLFTQSDGAGYAGRIEIRRYGTGTNGQFCLGSSTDSNLRIEAITNNKLQYIREFRTSTNENVYVDGNMSSIITASTPASTIGNYPCFIGSRNKAYFLSGHVCEIVICRSDLTALKSEIDLNINSYFTIY